MTPFYAVLKISTSIDCEGLHVLPCRDETRTYTRRYLPKDGYGTSTFEAQGSSM